MWVDSQISNSKMLISQCYCFSLLFSFSFGKIHLLLFQSATNTATNPVSHCCEQITRISLSAPYFLSYSKNQKQESPSSPYLTPFLPLLSPCHTVSALSYLFSSVQLKPCSLHPKKLTNCDALNHSSNIFCHL